MRSDAAVTSGRPLLRHAGWLVAVLLGAGLVALLAFGLLSRATDSTIDDALERSEPVLAPGFKLEVLHRGSVTGPLAAPLRRAAADGTIALDELRGTPVVVNFWASWCIPCRDEAPLLQRAWSEHGPDGVLFVGLNMQDVRDDARKFIATFKLTFPTVRDPSNATARRWGASGIPETFFIRRDGRVVGHVIGVISPSQLARGITAAAAGRATKTTRGGAQRPAR